MSMIELGGCAAVLRRGSRPSLGSLGLMSLKGHSLQIVGRRKSVHVRNAPEATVGRQGVARRDGPRSDIDPLRT